MALSAELKPILLVLQRSNANVERALRFISTFTAEAPVRKDRSCSIFTQDLISEVVLLTSAADKTVRTRACCLLAAIMQKLTVDIQDQTYEEIEEAMLGRLKDKVLSPPKLMLGTYAADTPELIHSASFALPHRHHASALFSICNFIHDLLDLSNI